MSKSWVETEKAWEIGLTRKIPSQPPEKLSQLARDIAQNLVFTSDYVQDTNILGCVFVPIAMGAFNDLNKSQLEDIGLIFEYYNASMGGRAINGYPIFFSCQYLNREDTEIVKEKVRKIKNLIGQI